MSLSRRVFSNSAIQIVARLGASLGNFVLFILINRYLTGEAFGTYTYYLTAFYLTGYFINFGANGIAVREVARGQGREESILGGVVRFKAASALVAIGCISALACYYEPGLESRLLVSASSLHLLCHALASPVVAFHVRLRFAIPALAQVAGTLVFLGTGLAAFALGCRRPEVFLLLYGAGNIVQSIIIFLASRRLVRVRFDQTFGEFMAFFREMLPIGISAVASAFYMYMDTLMLRQLKGEVAVGRYGEAFRLLTFALMVPQFFTQVLFPVLSRTHQKEPSLFCLLVRRALLYLMLGGVPLAIALQFLSNAVIHGLYRDPTLETVRVLQILAWAMLCIFAAYPFITALTAARRQIDFMRIAVLAGLVNLVLNLLWIPNHGILGAAWATVTTEGLVLVLSVSALLRVSAFNPLTLELWKVPVAGAAIGGLAFCVQDWSLVSVMIVSLVGIIVALAALRCLPFDLLQGARPAERSAAESFGHEVE